jgi:hypothetical protein
MIRIENPASVAGEVRHYPGSVTETFGPEPGVRVYDEGKIALVTMNWKRERVTCHLLSKGYEFNPLDEVPEVMKYEVIAPDYGPVTLTGKRVSEVEERDGELSRSLFADDVWFGSNVSIEAEGALLVVHPRGQKRIALAHVEFGRTCMSYDGAFELAWNPAGVLKTIW